MIKVYCDKCKKELTTKYYTISFAEHCLSNLSSVSTICSTVDCASTYIKPSAYDELNSTKMYCKDCVDQLKDFLEKDESLLVGSIEALSNNLVALPHKTDITDTINDVLKEPVLAVTEAIHKCPHCGKSHYRENYCTTTALYCPPVYKNGVNINTDKNVSTFYCTCLNCGKDFSIKR